MQKSLAKYLQIKFNIILKELDIIIEWNSSQGCKDSSTYKINKHNTQQQKGKDKKI